MTIKDFMNQADATKKIKIGATEGSAFFFVGTVEEFLTNIDAIEKDDLAYLNAKASNTATQIEKDKWKCNRTAFNDHIDRCKRNAEAAHRPYIEDRSDKAYERYLKALERKIKKANGKLKQLNEFLDPENYQPILEREVADIFPASDVVDTNTTVIITFGFEVGRYWTFNERGDADPLALFLTFKEMAA